GGRSWASLTVSATCDPSASRRSPRRLLASSAVVLWRGAEAAAVADALIEAGETIFFPELTRVAEGFPVIDVAFLPADGLQLRWRRTLAMDPEDAAQAVGLLRPKVVIPILDHDFSASLAGLVLRITGRVEDLKALVERRDPDVKVIV